MENYGSFKNLAGDKKGMSAEEAYIMLKNLGLLGQEFVPGATSLRKLMEGDFKGAGSELNDWIPGGKAVQNLVEGKDQDWEKNALDTIVFGKPLVKGVKKAASAIEKMPKGGKEGFIVLKKNQGDNKLKDVIEASNEAGQIITPEIEKEIRDHIGLTNALLKNPTIKAQNKRNNHYDNMSVEARQVIDAYLGQEQMHSPKPAGFDALPATERKAILEQNFKELGVDPKELLERSKSLKDQNYGGHYDYGVIYPDQASLDDYAKAVWDVEQEQKANPIASMDEFTGESFGGTPAVSNPTSSITGRIRPSYDHSRDFNGGTFQKLDPIDRGTLKGNGDLGERIFDAQSKFYTPDSKPGERINRTSNNHKFWDFSGTSKQRDPYNEAGIINDMNVKLNHLIDRERKLGFTDEEIYRKFKPEFDEYQGKIERYKTRLNSPKSNFNYDGAKTPNIPATPSEEINVLRSLGLQNDVDPIMGEIMDKTREHYKDLMKRIYQYESRFPQTPKLSTEQFKRLKDMGIRPEDIDMYLAEHPEFL